MAKVSDVLSQDSNHMPMESAHVTGQELSKASSKIPEIGKHKTAVALSMDAHSGLFPHNESDDEPDEDDMGC